MFSPPHQDRDNIYSQEPSTRLPREPAEGVKYLSKYEIFILHYLCSLKVNCVHK